MFICCGYLNYILNSFLQYQVETNKYLTDSCNAWLMGATITTHLKVLTVVWATCSCTALLAGRTAV